MVDYSCCLPVLCVFDTPFLLYIYNYNNRRSSMISYFFSGGMYFSFSIYNSLVDDASTFACDLLGSSWVVFEVALQFSLQFYFELNHQLLLPLLGLPFFEQFCSHPLPTFCATKELLHIFTTLIFTHIFCERIEIHSVCNKFAVLVKLNISLYALIIKRQIQIHFLFYLGAQSFDQ